MSSVRQGLRGLVEHPAFQTVVLTVIFVNAAVLGLEAAKTGWVSTELLRTIDGWILAIFLVEIGLRIIAWGPRFFTNAWNVFDFTVVAISIFPLLQAFNVLRAFRVFRVLRVITIFPQLRSVVAALLASIPGISLVGALLVIILFVASVIGTSLYGAGVPQYWGDLFTSMFTLFKVMTLESWPDVAGATMDIYPNAWLFFLVYILLATFTMLNLFVAIIVSAMEKEAMQGPPPTRASTKEVREVLDEVRALREEVEKLSGRLDGRRE
ncbi:MAG: ion transporter [Alphaproteobacteria bacterium]